MVQDWLIWPTPSQPMAPPGARPVPFQRRGVQLYVFVRGTLRTPVVSVRIFYTLAPPGSLPLPPPPQSRAKLPELFGQRIAETLAYALPLLLALAMAGAVATCAVAVLHEDDRGIPRSLTLFAARVEAEACRHAAAAAAASGSTGSDLVRAFRGRATPTVPIRQFLERVHLIVRSGDSTTRHMVRIDGTCFVLAALYLHRFLQSPAAREAGILVEPATAHRLAAVALFLGTKFGGHASKKWTIVSGRAIRAAEMADLEERFLRAMSFRLFVAYREFDWFSRVLVMAPPAARGSCATAISNRQADAAGGEEKGAQAPRGSCTTSHSNMHVDAADGEEKAPLAPLRLCSTRKKRQADATGGEEKGAQAPRGSCTTSRSKRQVDVADGEEKDALVPLRLCSTSKKRQADAMVSEEDHRRHVRACLPLPAVVSH